MKQVESSVFNWASEPMFIVSYEGIVTSINPAMERLCGTPAERLLGFRSDIFQINENSGVTTVDDIWDALIINGLWRGHVSMQNGAKAWLSVSPIMDINGCMHGFLGVASDIGDILSVCDMYQRLALYDPATGLPNRHMLTSKILECEAEHERHGRCFSLLFMDMDGFKAVNDTYGHAAGDEVLKLFAVRLVETIRKVDVACRLGGDEFVVLLKDTCADGAIATAHKIEDEISKPMMLSGGAVVNVGVSIGIASYPDSGRNGEDLIKVADAAMYRRKRLRKMQKDCMMPISPRLTNDERTAAAA